MAKGSVADLEAAFYRAGGGSGSLSDMRKNYAVQASGGTATPNMSVSDAQVAWLYGGPGDSTNITFLTRRWYMGYTVKFGPQNSTNDLRYERFGGDV